MAKKKIKDDDWHFRCNHEDKVEGKRILKEINKPADFLLTYFLKEFNTNSSRLRAEIEDIDAEKEAIDKQLIELQDRKASLDKRRYEAVNELNNTSLYDLDNYKNNDAVMGAIGSIKDYVITRKLTNFYDIPNNIFYNINSTYKVYDIDLLKEISLNEFDKWQNELKADDEDKLTDGQKMNLIADNLKDNFNGQRVTKDWKEFIKGKDDLIIRKANHNGLNPDDLKAFLHNKSYTHDMDKRR